MQLRSLKFYPAALVARFWPTLVSLWAKWPRLFPRTACRSARLRSRRIPPRPQVRPPHYRCHHQVAAAPGSPTCAGFAQV